MWVAATGLPLEAEDDCIKDGSTNEWEQLFVELAKRDGEDALWISARVNSPMYRNVLLAAAADEMKIAGRKRGLGMPETVGQFAIM